MESNKRALKTLLTLVLVVLTIFTFEQKFLVATIRGETLTNYASINWTNNIILLIDDFEGLANDSVAIGKASFFGYGSAKLALDNDRVDKNIIASKSCMKIQWISRENYGGWGKGVGKNIDLNTEKDFLSFRVFVPKSNGENHLKIMLEEDDNFDGTLQQDKDDSWFYKLNLTGNDRWEFVSIPLKDFADNNPGAGDGVLNISRKSGLHTILFAFEDTDKYTSDFKWYFDFVCFTNQKIQE